MCNAHICHQCLFPLILITLANQNSSIQSHTTDHESRDLSTSGTPLSALDDTLFSFRCVKMVLALMISIEKESVVKPHNVHYIDYYQRTTFGIVLIS